MADPTPTTTRREWLVIESSRNRAIFCHEESKGYIPRDMAERLLGRDLGGIEWFTREESALLHAHPEWRDTIPEGATAETENANA